MTQQQPEGEIDIHNSAWFGFHQNRVEKPNERAFHAKIKQTFKEFDTDKSGFIEPDEFILGMKRIMECDGRFADDFRLLFHLADCGLEGGAVRNVFTRHNKKGDGRLGEKEFFNFFSRVKLPPKNTQEVEKVIAQMFFTIIDKDGSKKITADELRSFLISIGIDKKDDFDAFMENLDRDAGGYITENEFIRWYCEM